MRAAAVGIVLAMVLAGTTGPSAPGAALAAGEVAPAGGRTAAAEDGDVLAPHRTRSAGSDRFATAAETSLRTFRAGAPTVFVATGGNFPDALAAGGVAGTEGAPILLTAPGDLPDPTLAELARLAPAEVVVLGGSAAITEPVAAAIGAATGVTPSRIEGATRFHTAAAISTRYFEPGVEVAYIATGTNFPDALAGGPLAAGSGAPILLVTRDDVPEPTAQELARLQPESIVVLGGPAAVGDDVVAELDEYTPGAVTRLRGDDRFLTAVEISESAYPDGARTVFLATGLVFADALSGAPAAYAQEGPVLLAAPDCVPELVLEEIARLQPDRVVVLGGRAALSDAAAALVPCGAAAGEIPLPTIAVDATLVPQRATVPDGEGTPRPVGAVQGPTGAQTDLVLGELLVVADETLLADVLERTGGTLLESLSGTEPATHRIAVDVSGVDASALPQMLRELDPAARGALLASSGPVIQLLALAASLAADGIAVGINAVTYGDGFADRVLAEAPAGFSGYDPNPHTWSYLNSADAPFTNVTEAWRAIALAGREAASTASRIPIGVLDGGFASSSTDYPPGMTGANGARNDAGACGGSDCPWHGTQTSITAAGRIDNAFGTAGVAGQVATVRAGGFTGDIFEAIRRTVESIATPILNMSFSFRVPAGLFFLVEPLQHTIAVVSASAGQIQVASAGNQGINVDATDCFIVCWEEEYVLPCEVPGVVCVGGLVENSESANTNSNYGSDSVDLWAPWTVYAGPDPDNPTNQVRKVGGTSFSAPFVAGVVALIKAANPSLSRTQVIDTLLTTARPVGGRVNRYVDAYAAVVAALGGNRPPELAVSSPTEGQVVRRNQNLSLSATASDPDGTPTVRWRIDGTQVATGTNATFRVDRDSLSLGAHTVTATITDPPYTIVETRQITVANTVPTGTILSPSGGASFYESNEIHLESTVYDPDRPGDVPPDADVSWGRPGLAAIRTGANPTSPIVPKTDLGVTGSVTLELRVEDPDSGAVHVVDTVTFTVLTDPADVPPNVTIISPANGEADDADTSDGTGWYRQVTFTATGDDPDPENDPVTLTWTAVYAGGDAPPGPAVFVGGNTGSSVTIKLYAGGCGTTWDVTVTGQEPDGSSNSDTNQYTTLLLC